MNIAPKENYIKTFSIFFLAMGIGTLIIVYAGFIWWQGLIASLGLWILAGTIGEGVKRLNKNIPEEKKEGDPVTAIVIFFILLLIMYSIKLFFLSM
tara:strand:+ start:109 stop:396 length:288 start_codon:yes stop_codon:yes gene_type:complete